MASSYIAILKKTRDAFYASMYAVRACDVAHAPRAAYAFVPRRTVGRFGRCVSACLLAPLRILSVVRWLGVDRSVGWVCNQTCATIDDSYGRELVCSHALPPTHTPLRSL